VIPPLRTAATTAALRRTTHLFVFGGGRLAISGVPASDSRQSVSSRGTGDADDPSSPERGPLVTDLVGKIAAFPLVLGSTAQPLRVLPFPIVSRIFHDFQRVCHPNFFIFSKISKRLLPLSGSAVTRRRSRMQERHFLPGGPCNDYAAKGPFAGESLILTFFSR
jgi:hypothetical protein